MADRAAVERRKQTFALYFGEVKGDPTPGRLGLRPGVWPWGGRAGRCPATAPAGPDTLPPRA